MLQKQKRRKTILSQEPVNIKWSQISEKYKIIFFRMIRSVLRYIRGITLNAWIWDPTERIMQPVCRNSWVREYSFTVMWYFCVSLMPHKLNIDPKEWRNQTI